MVVGPRGGVLGCPASPKCPAGGNQKRAAYGVGRRGDTSPIEDASCKETAAQNLVLRSRFLRRAPVPVCGL